jgi:hypothetical protein
MWQCHCRQLPEWWYQSLLYQSHCVETAYHFSFTLAALGFGSAFCLGSALGFGAGVKVNLGFITNTPHLLLDVVHRQNEAACGKRSTGHSRANVDRLIVSANLPSQLRSSRSRATETTTSGSSNPGHQLSAARSSANRNRRSACGSSNNLIDDDVNDLTASRDNTRNAVKVTDFNARQVTRIKSLRENDVTEIA